MFIIWLSSSTNCRATFSASRLARADGTLPLKTKEAPTLATFTSALGNRDRMVSCTTCTGLRTSTSNVFNIFPSFPLMDILDDPKSIPKILIAPF